MDKLKPVYLMAGGRSSRNRGFDHTMQAILNETGKMSPTIAYVGVASGDDKGFFKMIGDTMKKAGNFNLVHSLIVPPKADLGKAKDILNAADAVFMSGGDVEAGMQVLKEKGLTDFLVELFQSGKIFFGASAGSIMLAREWVRWRDPDDDSTAEIFPCLGIAPVICDTHAEEDDWEELKAALKLKEDNTRGFGIPSGSCLKVYPDGRVEALGGPVMQYLRQSKGVIKQPDLLPGK